MANLELTRPPRDCVSDVSFSMYNTEEIRRISVKEIAKPESFDELLHPVAGGLYDSSLGAVDMFSECASCGCKDKTCTGHAGHIELSLPVFNPIFFSFTFQLLKGTCFRCHRIFNGASSLPGRVILAQLQLLERGMISSVSSIQSFFSNAVSSHLEDTAEGDADGDNPKKQKSKRMTAVMEEEFYVQVEGNLRKLLKDLILSEGENGSETDCKQQQTRNICDLRRSLVTDFCSRFLYNRRKKCPYCRHTSAPVSRRAQQVIIIGSSQSRGKAVKKLDDQAPFDVPPGIDFGGATGSVNDKRIKQELLIDDGTKSLDDESVQEVISNLVAGNESPFSVEPEGRRILSPIEARRHLREVWAKDQELLQAVFPLFAAETRPGKTVKGKCPTDLLFCDVVSLPPSQFRPVSSMNGLKFESRQTVGFRQVLEMNMVLKYFVSYSRGGENNADKQLSEQIIAKVRGRSFAEKLQNTYIMLQARVNGLLDAALAPKPAFGRQQNADQTIGLRQILEKKEGMFRMYMMGKRVNFACRTVITPDPYMDVDGIGIPDVFAKKLTFPTFVNQLNLQQMRRAVVNGPKTHPGANCIVSEYGHSMLISDSNERERKGTAKRLLANDKRALVGPKKVLRQLLPDDYMLVNRQPTLHKPSIMAHKVHILRDQKTMRLNYSTCKTYNADFDGDEMNAHLPQDLLSQSECQEIANVINQYLVPKDGTPISGLIQDHIVSGVLLTLKDKFFSKEDYEYLVMSAFGFLKQKLRPLPPTIWKPVVRWTGKQVVSTVILNVIPEGYPLISLDGKAKTGVKTWRVAGHQEPSFDMSDSHVVFRNCELLVGVFDKAHYGPTAYGLVHCCYEIYGPRVACNLLSCFSRLFTTYLQLHGFTLGVADVLVGRKADKKRKKITKKLSKCGAAVMRDVFKAEGERECRRALDECYSKRDRSDIKQLDFGMKSQTDQVNDEVNKACLPDGLVRLFPDNGLLLMIECGAKGNMVNSMQMSCMLGQIELEGCRPPVTPSGRSLPSFKSFDHSPRAGGFVAQRFLTGVRPQEFFFHCMAGREGLIDTAVKTSRSGYLQRCLIKHLESVIVNYDMTVRDADQSIIQFQYGEDGLDIGKVQFLQGKQLDFLLDNFDSLRISLPEEKHLERLASTKPEKLYRKISKWLRKHPHSENSDTSKRPYDSPFTAFARNPTFGHLAKDALINEWKKLNEEERQEYIGKYGGRCPDPVASVRNPYCELGVLPEQLLKKLEELGKSYNRRELFDQFRRAIYWKGMKSLAEPGEAVGLLAAQSIGEPSTQMTLNTFHFAGRGEMNVTLGIPRLREILMTASERMSTPAAQVPFRAHVTPEAAKELHRTINTITLEDVLESIEAEERLTLTASATHREYKVTLKLSRQRARPYATSHLRCSAIMEKMEKSLFKRVAMELKKMCDNALAYEKSCAAGREKAVPTGGDGDEDETVPEVQPSNVEEEEVSDDERENVDKTEADASVEQMRQKHSDENEYVGEEEEADAVDQKDADDENSSESETESIAVNENAQTMDVEDEKPKIVPPKAAEPEKQLDAKRVKTVLNCANTIIDYEYDTKKNRWCQITIRILARFGSVDLISLFRAEAKRFPVQSIPGVKRCVLGENKGRQVLITEGVNLQAVFERAEHFEVNKIYCNDIHVVAKTYGIEAALKALIKETKNVFGNYGIVVDYRHLSLMADYMMHTGSYRPFNRSYMSSSTSPFQKMSFETTMKFLRDALEAGENDPLRSVSASIAAGRMPKVGTGFFDVLVKLK